MSDTITAGAMTITPDLVNGYQTEQQLWTTTHDIIGRSDPDVTFHPAGLRRGTLELIFGDEADADTARAQLAASVVWSLASTDRPTLDMTFVVTGTALAVSLEDQTRNAWVVRVPYHEVAEA